MMISEPGDAACVAKAAETVIGANLARAAERHRDWRLEVFAQFLPSSIGPAFAGTTDAQCTRGPNGSSTVFEDLIRGGKDEALSTSTCRPA